VIIFRDDINAQNQRSPERSVFGLDPITKKVLVPIDVCLFSLESGNPVLNPNLPTISNGAKILDTPVMNLIGKVASISIPNFAITVDPIITLDTSSLTIPVIDSVDVTNIKVDDNVFIKLEDNTTISGKIISSIVGLNSGASLIQEQTFPSLGAGFKVQAIQVKFSQIIVEELQGTPIFMASSNKVLGMLMGTGTNILAFHI
jgi:hypothetical protein